MACTLKNAKAWFLAHPKNKVVYHRFMTELPAARQENLQLPRTTEVTGTRVRFSDGSELSLFAKNGETSLTTPGGLLDLFDNSGQIIVTYAPVAK